MDLPPMIAKERALLADELEKLTDAQWNHDSAMPGWKVKHVAAHLLWPLETSTGKIALQMLRNGFNFGRTADYAAGLDTRGPKDMAAALRRQIDNKFAPPGLGLEAVMTDLLVYGMDIRAPLKIAKTFEKDAYHVVLNSLMKKGNVRFFHNPRPFKFVAEDAGWSGGEGATVSGPANALMHAMTGRKIGLAALSGDGADAYRAAFTEYVG